MARYTAEDLDNAVQDVKSGISYRKASVKWGIPYTTLYQRANGHTSSRKESQQHRQRLSNTQETALVNWILTQAELGLAPTHQQVRHFAQKILANGDDHQPLGKHWMEGFFKRNPAVKTLKSKKISNARVTSVTVKFIQDLFDRLKNPTIRNIPPQHRYNMDETGIMKGQGLNGLVVGHAKRANIYVKSPETRVWTSILECVSATGKSIDPLIIFRGKSIQQQWFPSDMAALRSWHFTASENGWITNDIAVEWLTKIFFPSTIPPANETRLLVVDGHGSHVSDNFMYECFSHNVYILFLPAHSSHITQPLDLSVFSPLKHAYRRYLEDLVFLSDSAPIGKQNFLRCYFQARKEALTERNIRSGWKASGLWPIDKSKPLSSRQFLGNSQIPASISVTQPQIPTQAEIYTPKRSTEVLSQARDRGMQSIKSRLFVRKIGKAMDEKDITNAKLQEHIRSLEVELDLLRPKKRAKVNPNPNERFVQIKQIKEAQEEARRAQEHVTKVLNPKKASQALEKARFEDMCFEFQL